MLMIFLNRKSFYKLKLLKQFEIYLKIRRIGFADSVIFHRAYRKLKHAFDIKFTILLVE